MRGQKVILDRDLAELYGVPTRRLNEQVKRNRSRFPADFMFPLKPKEAEILRSQFAISSSRHGGRRTTPYAFTEQGVAMLSGVLNSEQAVRVNIAIMRAFVKLREIIATHKELAEKIGELENKFQKHDSRSQRCSKPSGNSSNRLRSLSKNSDSNLPVDLLRKLRSRPHYTCIPSG